MSKCTICGEKLKGLQRKFCSKQCKAKDDNNVFQNYAKQRERAFSRKRELVFMLGGECCKCGYSKNMAALTFHHVDPKKKEFSMTSRELSNGNFEKKKQEAKKCILLCANCHLEHHNPDMYEWWARQDLNL